MMRRTLASVALIGLTTGSAAAQEFPPGFVDPEPLLAAAEAESSCLCMFA